MSLTVYCVSYMLSNIIMGDKYNVGKLQLSLGNNQGVFILFMVCLATMWINSNVVLNVLYNNLPLYNFLPPSKCHQLYCGPGWEGTLR